jgi:hypothetical protein
VNLPGVTNARSGAQTLRLGILASAFEYRQFTQGQAGLNLERGSAFHYVSDEDRNAED